MFVTAVESYQQIRYRVYYIMLNQHVFFKCVYIVLFRGEYMHYLSMSRVEISTTNSVNKISNAIYFLRFFNLKYL